ncbi:hypothetical protein MMC25_004827 [Agyrium rufum]|nr:hypothetical protein [Agyrium rufum]
MSLIDLLPTWPHAIFLCFAIGILYVLITDFATYIRMPPGPIPLPFVGNKYSLPPTKPWIKFQEWSKQYGPIFTVWIGRRPTLVISDPNIAVDLLEKRSNKYSSRPRFIAMGELHWDMAPLLVQPYGKGFSTRRKLLHHALTPSALRFYKPIQEAEASRLCAQLLDDPVSWEQLIDRYTASIVFSVAYGHRIDSMSAAVIRERFRFMQTAANLNVPGKYLVETLPFLKHVPTFLAPWKRGMIESGKEEAEANVRLLRLVEKEIAHAKETGAQVADSLTKLILELREKEHIPLSERDFSYIPSSLFGAGSDTTASTLCSGFLGLVTNPETLKNAHKELDSVIGSTRTPTFADEPNLPYIRALAKEILRWRPVAVLGGTPHASTEDDYYEGWFIPKGTTVLGNTWAINLNDAYYPDPHHFEPLRFMDPSLRASFEPSGSTLTPKGSKIHPNKAGHSSFGWGRRICPGEGLALHSLFIALAKILWAYDVLPSEGCRYDINDYTDGFNIRPKKFECIVRVRSEAHKTVLLEESKTAEEYMARFPAFQEEA